MRNRPNERPARPLGRSPMRRCILTGDERSSVDMLRVALGPDGGVAPDVRAKAPGRGAWIGVSRAELEAAQAKRRLKGALARAFKTGAMTIPDDLGERAERALERHALDRLGLEARGGTLLTGAEKIATAARRGELAALYHAADAAADGRAKLDQAWRAGSDREGSGLAGLTLPVDRTALSMALGRSNVVHVGVTDARAATRIGEALARWQRFAGGSRNKTPGIADGTTTDGGTRKPLARRETCEVQ